MLDGYAHLGSATCMHLRRLWAGHTMPAHDDGGAIWAWLLQPYSFRANLSTEPMWYGDDEFPLLWAIANYIRWRTKGICTPISLSFVYLLTIHCLLRRQRTIAFFKPVTITKAQRGAWLSATRKILQALYVVLCRRIREEDDRPYGAICRSDFVMQND